MRTTADAVKGIIETDDDTFPNLAPFIEAANQLVTDCCLSSGYSAAKLERIERWLAAHFYAIEDPRITQEITGPIQASFGTKLDLGFDVTTYGQQAMRLDTDGNLAALNNSMKTVKKILPAAGIVIGATYLGNKPCD
jgi:hypothetical protein